MEIIKDKINIKVIDGGKVQSKREIIEVLNSTEYMNNITKIELAIAQAEENIKQNKKLLKALEGNGVREFVEKFVKESRDKAEVEKARNSQPKIDIP